jgi:hypothetical protein
MPISHNKMERIVKSPSGPLPAKNDSSAQRFQGSYSPVVKCSLHG